MTDRSQIYKTIRMAFIYTVKTPMHHCSNIACNTKNVTAETD